MALKKKDANREIENWLTDKLILNFRYEQFCAGKLLSHIFPCFTDENH